MAGEDGRATTQWKIELLDGDRHTMRLLGCAADAMGASIDKEKKADGTDDWLLYHPDFDALQGVGEVQKRGQQLTAVLNAVLRACYDGVRPARLGAIVDRRISGKETRSQPSGATAVIPFDVRVNATVQGAPTPPETSWVSAHGSTNPTSLSPQLWTS